MLFDIEMAYKKAAMETSFVKLVVDENKESILC